MPISLVFMFLDVGLIYKLVTNWREDIYDAQLVLKHI